jgi:hypothetical protein
MKTIFSKGHNVCRSKPVANKQSHQSVTQRAKLPCPERPHVSLQRLAPWFALANLLPSPPSFRLTEGNPDLQDPMKVRLWEKECSELPKEEFTRRFRRSVLARSANVRAIVGEYPRHLDPNAPDTLHQTCVAAASALRALAAGSAIIREFNPAQHKLRLSDRIVSSVVEVWIQNRRITTSTRYPLKEFFDALEGVAADSVRQCESCDRLFFALRKDQKACSKPCNARRCVRQWRALQAKYEYQRKLKRAGVTTQATR